MTSGYTPDPEALSDLAEHMEASLAGALRQPVVTHAQIQAHTTPAHLLDALRFLRDDPSCRFVAFTDLCGVDYPGREKRFELVYHLLSPYANARIRLKAPVGEGEAVPSCCGVFPGAEWYEREVYDMFGVMFTGHPDLRRILTDYGFSGHPLRKDFPLCGFVEARYDEDAGRVIHEPAQLQQARREFDALSPWTRGEPLRPPPEEKARDDE